MNTTIFDMAMEVLETKSLPKNLQERLNRVEEIVNKLGGSTSSRQIVAIIIMQWEQDGSPTI